MSWPGVGVVFPALDQDYEFLRLLGQGSTGWVVLARHRQLGRPEAIKIIRGGSRQLPAVRRLEREGRVLARLDHPNIVSVYRQLTSSTSLALAMEYLPGGDLQQAMAGDGLFGSDRVGVLAQVAGALTAAASVGVVHRDVKPSNVLLDGVGRAVLADFGLARLPADTGAFRTMSGALTGTPLFMAPEQIEHPDVDTPSIDGYAFGVLAYRLLLGAWPYPAGTVAEVMQAHLVLAPTPPWEHLRNLPRPAGEALLGALSKDPDRRLLPGQVMDRLGEVSAVDWNILLTNDFRSAHADGSVPPHSVAGGVADSAGGSEAAGTAASATGAESIADADTSGTSVGAVTGEHRPPAAEITAGAASRRGGERATIAVPVVDQEWVRPPVYTVPRRVSQRMLAVLVGIAVGILVGMVVFLVLNIT
jgi:serine/threonine protein kinase